MLLKISCNLAMKLQARIKDREKHYSRLRYVRASVEKTLNKSIMPNSAASPIQYQYEPGK